MSIDIAVCEWNLDYINDLISSFEQRLIINKNNFSVNILFEFISLKIHNYKSKHFFSDFDYFLDKNQCKVLAKCSKKFSVTTDENFFSGDKVFYF